MRERFEKVLWYLLTPIFPSLMRTLLRLHIIEHIGRQPYILGYIASGKTLEGLKKHLSDKWGFSNHFIAWTDTDQILSWRKRVNFNEQYHLRVFKDGEV